MKKNIFRISLLLGIALLAIQIGCKKAEKNTESEEETPVSGKATVLVEETIFPVIDDEAILFENEYDRAKLTLEKKTETAILQSVYSEKSQIVVMPRTLDSLELQNFKSKQIIPRITEIGTDALAFIVNYKQADSTITTEEIMDVMLGKKSTKIKSLVFDNANSSTVRTLKDFAKVKELPKEGVSSLNSNEELLNYIASNTDVVGVIGVNWLLQTPRELQNAVINVKVLGVNNNKLKNNKFFKPTQSNIATGDYPFTRKMYVLNFQGTTGLGMGFASFVAGQKGQRIMLKSGLVPAIMPTREIQVRN
ncbi:PstS family phosphate ABC transporter substrate-binding protein [Flavobacterium cerinum]|uniref:Substrate-binding domain-containing protein n=1 Tax=Flavobacterium cerinum TaxID=2502784 RepID=A0ABY5IXK3_9FLAO|nr:substrate-binding domain-containing protein [Flavobacterium cerinum]UUC46852.1 substrate-binding domain-containing protein [Flavobacterium cerinum]